jgi:hypothetical protein
LKRRDSGRYCIKLIFKGCKSLHAPYDLEPLEDFLKVPLLNLAVALKWQ